MLGQSMKEFIFNCAAPLKRTSSWCFDERSLIQALHKVWNCFHHSFVVIATLNIFKLVLVFINLNLQILSSISKSDSIVLYIRDIEAFLYRSERAYKMFEKMLDKVSGPVLVLGSRVLECETDASDIEGRVSNLFPYTIEIRPPEEGDHLINWKTQLEDDMKTIQIQDNKNHIMEVLASNDLEIDDLGSICLADTMIISNYIEEIIVSAISYHLMNTKDPEYRNGKLVISLKRSVNIAFNFLVSYIPLTFFYIF